MKHLTSILLALGLLVTVRANADEPTAFKPRQGFFMGFDVGGGGASLAGTDRGAFLLGLKIGGGINEKVLLLAELSGSSSQINGVTVGISGLHFASQLFLAENFYLRPAIGVASARFRSSTFTTETDSGFSTMLASGYEFRLTPRFALSPELKFAHAYIEEDNFYWYGGTVDLRWYF